MNYHSFLRVHVKEGTGHFYLDTTTTTARTTTSISPQSLKQKRELVVIRGSFVVLALYAPSTLHWEEFENAALFLQLGVLSTLITTVTKTEHFKNALQTRGV